MKFKCINFKKIQPFVRFTLSTVGLMHFSYVVPLEHRIIFIEYGSAEIWVDGNYYKMEKNDTVYISSGTPYKVKSDNSTGVFVMYFDLTMENQDFHERIKPIGIKNEKDVPEYLSKRYICKYKLEDNNKEVPFLYTSKNSAIALWLNDVKQILNRHNVTEYCESMVTGLMISIISKMLDSNQVKVKQSSSQTVNLILSYIHSRYNENATLEDVASALNFHKNYLNYCMKKELGTTIHKYMINYRLTRAMDFFMYTDLSVAEVAEKVGYKDAKGFAVAFKNFYSISPSKVKKLN